MGAFRVIKRDAPAIIIAVLVGLPVLMAAWTGLAFGGGEAWIHIAGTKLWLYSFNTVAMLFLTAGLILVFAVPAAWAVTMYAFPGRRAFEWLLILPLAAPGYVIAYAWADLTGVTGPLQSAIQDTFNVSARDYWFPEVSGLIGTSFVLACALYPYVYLTARAAFTTQSSSTIDAARALGASPRRTFFEVALPAARPAIAAGLVLALMEAAADYGAADFLGLQTLTVGVVRAKDSFGDVGIAARMALILIVLVLFLQWLERVQRGNRGVQNSSSGWRSISRKKLPPTFGAALTLMCAMLFILTFAAPIGRQVWLGFEVQDYSDAIGSAFTNSILLAGGGAALAFIFATCIALGARANGFGAQTARFAAMTGYATPGAVLALGGLWVAGYFPMGLGGSVAIALLIWIYATRFTASGAEPMSAALARAPANMGYAAQSLGCSPTRRILRVDLPIAMSGAAAGALILFVEALKELPATMMLIPFDWDTLAIKAHNYATDDRLAAAALPSVAITLAGLGPVILLSRKLSNARPGA